MHLESFCCMMQIGPEGQHWPLTTKITEMRILLADDHKRVRFALRVLLERQPGFEVTGEAINAEELVVQMNANRPDLVLLGWELPGLEAVGLLSALRKTGSSPLVIALSGRTEARRAALAAGADAFVSKADSPERLLAVIENCSCNQRGTRKPPDPLFDKDNPPPA